MEPQPKSDRPHYEHWLFLMQSHLRQAHSLGVPPRNAYNVWKLYQDLVAEVAGE